VIGELNGSWLSAVLSNRRIAFGPRIQVQREIGIPNVNKELDEDWPLVGSVLWFAIGGETFRPEFYEIVRETAKSVIVERIGQIRISGDVYEGTVVPDRTVRPDKDKTGMAMQYRVKKPTDKDNAFKGKVEWHVFSIRKGNALNR
jgi:hypothetical protein